MTKPSTNVQNAVIYMHKMEKEATKNKQVRKKENSWIDVHNDDIMREMGFDRPFNQSPRDPSVWQKTPNERRLLKSMKYSAKRSNMHFHTIPPKRATVCAKLIIQLKPNNIFPKSTYSFECLNTHVETILGKFKVTNSKTKCPESFVAKYSYNGKPYVSGDCLR